MVEPVMLLADGSGTRALVEAELHKRYEADYRVIATASAREALEVLDELRNSGSQVCLVLADQWLPGATGTELLAQVRQLHPAARRALLISWGPTNTEAVVRATVLGDLDTYLV
jgi:thioredoxin reductase (NADPH)